MIASTLNERLLDEKLIELEKARSWSPRVIAKLESLIRTGSDYELFRINPLKYATEKGLSEAEAIDLFLYATKIGLFEMEWHLVCPSCGHIVESLTDMKYLHAHVVCKSCYAETDITLDDCIQVAFTILASVRDNIFRRPRSLSPEDFYYRYSMSQEALYTNGQRLVEVMMNLTAFVGSLPPHAKTNLNISISPGTLVQFLDFTKDPSLYFIVSGEQTQAEERLQIHLADGSYQSISHELKPFEIQLGEFVHRMPLFGQVPPGKLALEIDNSMDESTPIWLRLAPPGAGSTAVTFLPFLSGKRLLTTQTFRDLFRSEAYRTNEDIGVKDITFLFTDLKGSTTMYDEIGDAKAYYLVRQHFETLGKAIQQNRGAIIKTIGDAVMATFIDPVDAVKAAVDMIKELDEFNKSISQELILKIGIHRGHSIVVTVNERLDYFGQTVNIAARVQALSDADEIVVSDDAFLAPGMDAVVGACEVTAQTVAVKGVSSKLAVHKIRVRK